MNIPCLTDNFLIKSKWISHLIGFWYFFAVVFSLRVFDVSYALIGVYLALSLVFVLVFLFYLKFKVCFLLCFYFLISLAAAVLYSSKSGFTVGFYSIVSPVISAGIAICVWLGCYNVDRFNRLLVFSSFLMFFLFLLFYRFGVFDVVGLFRGSKNYLINYALIISFCFVLSFKGQLNNNKEAIILFALVVMAFLSTSLGAIIVAGLGFLYYLMFRKFFLFVFFMILVFALVNYVSFHTIDWVFDTKLVEKYYRGSTRAVIWMQYLSGLTFLDFFIGGVGDLAFQVKGVVIENIHSSFFLGVHKYGFVIVSLQYVFILYLIVFSKASFISKTFLLMFFVRSLYDTMFISHGYVDWVIYYVILEDAYNRGLFDLNSLLKNKTDNILNFADGDS